MKILKNIKNNFRKYKILKTNKQKKRNINFSYINDVNSIAIIAPINNSGMINKIGELHKNELFNNKNLDIFVVKNKKNQLNVSEKITFFDKNEITFFHKIKNENIKNFYKKKYDILLNLDTSLNIYTLYLSTLSTANFKVAAFSDINSKIFDFMIKISTDSDISILIEQIIYYLNKNNHK